MLCFILVVIPLILPAFGLADQKIDKHQTVCEDAAVISAGDKAYSSFSNEVHNILTNQTTNNDDKFIRKLFGYILIANDTCYKDRTVDKSLYLFRMLWTFSLRNGKFNDFVNRDGVSWIKAIKQQMTDCVSKAEVMDAGDKYAKLWKKSKLHVNKVSCTDVTKIKMCTIKALRTEGLARINETKGFEIYHYNVLYVSSLFDFMIEICDNRAHSKGSKEVTTTTEEPEVLDSFTEEVVNSAKTTHSLLAIVLILAVSGILYIVYRECRAKPGSWKNINGNFEMGCRRRSLVNNEMCESRSLPPAASK